MKNIFRVFAWVRRYPLLAVSTLGCAVVSVLCGLVFPRAVQQILDVVIPEKRGDLLGFWVMMTLAAYFARDLLNGLRIFLNNTFEQKVIFDVRSDLYARLQRLPLPWFDGRPTGDIMTTVAEDVTAVERVLIDGIEQGLVAVLQVVVFSVWLFSLNATLGAIALLPIPLLAAGALFYTLTAKDRYRGVRKATSFMNSLLMDNIGGIRQIKAYTREEAEHGRFNAASERLRQATLKVMRAWSFYNPTMMFLGATGSVLVLWFGGRQVLAGTMMPGQLTSFLVTLALVYEPIGRLHSLNQIFQAGRAASERVFDILDAEEEESLEDDGGHRVQQPVRGHVEYRNVSFAYNERIATLSGVSLEARPGETVALVGPTGAGKSTIINLLCRFYELPRDGGGEILLDGHSIRDITKSSLRGAIGYVTQESFLFNGTIRDNLLLARPGATEDELWSALEAANARGFVERLPQQLDTEVGERGVRLSVGEKQRVSIARALLKNPPILLLDEATASVDTETERQIQQALDRLMEGRTSFVIAHRLSTVRHAHRIYVLDQGRVAEQGTHDELLARPGGLYAELCRHSFLIEEKENQVAGVAADDAGSASAAVAAAAAAAAREAAERERAAAATQLASLQREQAETERARATLETELAHALAGRAETESAATRAAAEAEAERRRLEHLDDELAASEASRATLQEALMAAQEELAALRTDREASRADREREQAERDARIRELEAALATASAAAASGTGNGADDGDGRHGLVPAAPAAGSGAPAAGTGAATEADAASVAAAVTAAAEVAAARKRVARLDRDLAASEASRLKLQEDLLSAQEEVAALRAAHDAGRADQAVEEDAREARLAELEAELAAVRQQLGDHEKRRLTLEAELDHVRAANEKLEAGLPVAPLPPPLPAHPELPLQLPPSRPLVVYTSRGL